MSEDDNEPRGLLETMARAISPLVHHAVISILAALVGLLAPLLYILFGESYDFPIGILIGIVVAYFGLNVLTDRVTRTFLDVEISVLNLTVRLMRLTIAERTVAAREMALSLTYLGKLKQRHSTIKLALLACAGTLAILSFKFPTLDLLDLATVAIATLGLLALKEAVVEYRIRSGLFGTTRSEARELIDFIVKNSDDIDFTDSNGNLRKALLPEDVAKRNEPTGQLLPGGAVS